MILNMSYFLFIFVAVWVSDVLGAPYSNVFVQSKSQYTPVEYVQYGSPAVSIVGARLAQLSGTPVRSVLPVQNYVSPCESPCLVSGQNIAPIEPAANFVTYNTPIPSSPVVIPRDETTSYEYSYVVYDEHTGDQKAQREHSDGTVVRGEYSFIQPDGYVREVQYVADDANGFNAIVKNILPASVGEKKKVEHKIESHPAPNCNVVFNEHIKDNDEVIEVHQKSEAIKEATHHEDGDEKHEDRHTEQSHSDDLYGNKVIEHDQKETHDAEEQHGHPSEAPSEHHSPTEVPVHDLPEVHNAGHVKDVEEADGGHEEKVHNENIESASSHTEVHESSSSEPTIIHESQEGHSDSTHLNVHDSEAEKSPDRSESAVPKDDELNHEIEHQVNNDYNVVEHQEAEDAHDVEVHEEKQSEPLKVHGHSELTDSEDIDGPLNVVNKLTEIEQHDENSGLAISDIIRCVNTAMTSAPTSHKTQPSPLTYIIMNKPC